MKNFILALTAAAMLSTTLFASSVRTNVLNPGDPALVISVPEGHILTVLNFLSNGPSLASLSVTKDGKTTPVIYPVDISSQRDIRQLLTVAGAATVTVTNTSSPVMVSYRLDPNQ